MISRLRILLLQEDVLNVHRAFRFIAICESWSGEDFTQEKAKIQSSLFSRVDLDKLIVKMTNILGDDFMLLVEQSVPLLSSDETYIKDFGFYTAVLNPVIVQETHSTHDVLLSEHDFIPLDYNCKLSRSSTRRNLNETPDRISRDNGISKARSTHRSRESWCVYPYVLRVFAVCCGNRDDWYSKS
jgi:hypothetical protein